MINPSKRRKYLSAIKEGFESFGLNGFYQMHQDILENQNSPWEVHLMPLNHLNFDEFEELCQSYLNKTK